MQVSTFISRPFAAAATGKRTRSKAAATAEKAVTPKKAPKEKKPPTAYALYMKEVFPLTKVANPNAPFETISKTVSNQWKQLDDNGKAKFNAASKAAWEAWHATQPAPVVNEKKPRKKKTKDPTIPKKPPTPYALYVKQNFKRLASPGAKAPDTMKLLSAEWKGLSEAEKAKYKNA